MLLIHISMHLSPVIKHSIACCSLVHMFSMPLIQVLEYDVFEPLALEFCARVSAFNLQRSQYCFIDRNHNIVLKYCHLCSFYNVC